nr:response regulator [Tenacibaculum sp. SG-28]
MVVTDEGRGISAEEIELVFQPFYQAKNSTGTGGSGLGLSLTKSLIELHGGMLEVESVLDEGSRFVVKLPEEKAYFENKSTVSFVSIQKGEINEDVKEMDDSEESTIVQNSSNQVILIVDDNKDIRSYISSLLQETFTILEAENGKKALEIAREVGPDIIISDIMMPEMDGHELCHALKNDITTSHIPILLLTAKGDKKVKITSFNKGADDYITKPFDSGVLISRVQNILKSRADLKRTFENKKWEAMQEETSNSVELEFLNKVEATVLEIIPKGNLNVIDLCRELGFSRTSLYRKVKSLTGLSINQLIRSIKMKRAAEMLLNENMNISEVAFSLDFKDLKYFRTAFKKQYGMVPSKYIKMNKTENTIDPERIKKEMNF